VAHREQSQGGDRRADDDVHRNRFPKSPSHDGSVCVVRLNSCGTMKPW
jgi:hypothetical protein